MFKTTSTGLAPGVFAPTHLAGLQVCDGGVVAGVAGLLLAGEDVVELQVTRARAQHQEALTCRERTAGEAALVAVALVEDRHRSEPGEGVERGRARDNVINVDQSVL